MEINARQDDTFEFGRNIIPRMMFEQRRVYGYKFKGYWGYTRTIEEFWQSNMDLLGSEPKINLDQWGIRTNLEHRNIRDCQPLKVGCEGAVRNSLIYNGCTVNGHVENSILFPGVHVKKGAVVKNSVLFFNNFVGQEAQLDKVVSDVNVTIGSGVRIGDKGPVALKKCTVLGWNNCIPDKTVIGSDCTLYPHLRPEKLPSEIKTGEVVR